MIATWCFIFVGVIRELSAAIMLFTSETKVISVLIFDLNESGDLGAIAVLGLIMLVVTFAVVVLINRIPGFGGGTDPPAQLTDPTRMDCSRLPSQSFASPSSCADAIVALDPRSVCRAALARQMRRPR